MFRSHAVPPLRKRNSVFSRAKKGYFSTFSRRWGRENALCAAIAQRGGWRRPIYVPGAERGAAGASRGRAGAEKRKSRFLGRVGTTLSRMKLYSTRVQFDSGWSGTENGDFRLSAPARPRDAPGAPRPAPGTSIGRLHPPRCAISARGVFSRPQRRKKVEK